MANEIRTGNTAHLAVSDAAAQIQGADTVRSIPLFRHGTLLVKYYAPRGNDPQTPHTRYELYVVAQGRGIFFDGKSKMPLVPGSSFRAGFGRLPVPETAR